MLCDSNSFCCFCPLLGLVALNESSLDPEGATVTFINSNPTQNNSGVADEVEKCFSEREWCLLLSISSYKAKPV